MLNTRSTDQNQQKLTRTTNHKKFGMAIFGGDFRIWEEQSKNWLEKWGQGLQIRGNLALDTR